jgi:integrase
MSSILLGDGCGFRFLPDISPFQAMDWLARLRRDATAPEIPPGKQVYTRSEAATALGMSETAFRDAVKRQGLPATGKGPARRYPLVTVATVRDRLSNGRSVQTTNYYVSHLKSFCRWLIKDRRVAENPVAHLEAGNVEVDSRHDRRELTADELRKLLETTRSNARTLRGMTGEDRFMLYGTACGTGFRAGALASLTPAHFDLDDTPGIRQ